MNRRAGATLMEVLVAIFIMGIGLLAILALFPLGAIRMAQAVQDDRAGHLALNGLAVAQTYNLRNDPVVTAAFANPGGGLPPAHPDLPGYPVYADPFGVLNFMGNVGDPAAGLPLAITRKSPSFLSGSRNMAIRWFTLLDDMRFGPDGIPPATGSAVVEREGTLSYALMFRQPRSAVPNVVEVSVVVYSRRPLLTPIGVGEATYPAQFNTPSTNMITLNTKGQAKPRLQAGSWILDGTFQPGKLNGQPALYNGQPTGWAHGYFYRVVSVNQIDPNTVEVEVATPLRDWPNATIGTSGTIIVMDNVVEVLERGTGW